MRRYLPALILPIVAVLPACAAAYAQNIGSASPPASLLSLLATSSPFVAMSIALVVGAFQVGGAVTRGAAVVDKVIGVVEKGIPIRLELSDDLRDVLLSVAGVDRVILSGTGSAPRPRREGGN